MQEDIIVACGTPQGYGGISIIRISGTGATNLAEKIFISKKKLSTVQARYMVLGKLKDRDGQIFDNVLAVRFEQGQSYTGEEMVEIHCHGGLASANHCISEILSLGGRLATKGEFTRRAFTNGKMNLPEAEAVNTLINSTSTNALRAAGRTLIGELTDKIKNILQEITNFSATLEVDLDFPEEGEGLLSQGEKIKTADNILVELKKLLAQCKAGRLLQNGLNIAIIGLPNVGKSSTLNALIEKDKAIVTPIPGTTRDTIEEKIVLGGIPINVIDTAGIRETSDIVESLGVKRSCDTLKNAGLVLCMLDTTQKALKQIDFVKEYIKDANSILLLNKIDAEQQQCLTKEKIQQCFPNKTILEISAKERLGIEALKELIIKIASTSCDFENAYSISSRQEECLIQTKNEMEEVLKLLNESAMPDIIITTLSSARRQMANFLGLDATEDLLDTVFATFCVGK